MAANYTIPQTADPVELMTIINIQTNNYFGTAIVIFISFIFFFLGYKLSNSVSAGSFIGGLMGLLVSLGFIAIGMDLWYPMVICLVTVVVSGVAMAKSE